MSPADLMDRQATLLEQIAEREPELFATVGRAVTDVRGEAAALNIGSPGTDGRVFRRIGIPVAVFGPQPFNLGAPDEYITVRDYLDTVRVHALSALDFLSRPA
jgi:succinyl-diaminopimelate desuccinylase